MQYKDPALASPVKDEAIHKDNVQYIPNYFINTPRQNI